MADSLTFTGWPKGVVGDIARDTTQRPKQLRMKAQDTITHESTVGGNNERKNLKQRIR